MGSRTEETVARASLGSHELIATLARISRASASEGEARAAGLLAAALEERGGRTRLEPVAVRGSYLAPHGPLMLLAAAAGVLGGRRGLALGALSAAAVWDDLAAGPRLARRLLARRRRSVNVVSEFGPADAPRLVIVSAHHDAARSGLVFHPVPGRLLSRAWRLAGSTPPATWPLLAAPALAALGAASGSRGLRRQGVAWALGVLASLADVQRHGPVPGANDNLSGVAALCLVADELARRPAAATRVLLLSTGSEEIGLEGMRGFVRDNLPLLRRRRTTLVCLDAVGSRNLVLARREGLLRTRPYSQSLGDSIGRHARALGIQLAPPLTVRGATDGFVALAAGIEAAALVSVDESGYPGNYHWPSDVPEALNWKTIDDAARLALGVVRDAEGGSDERSG